MNLPRELNGTTLSRKCNPEDLGFQTTDEIQDDLTILGQSRATNAIEFGINVQHRGYNIFVLGPSGMGKKEIVQDFFSEKAQSDPVPSDWIYVHDFDNQDQPQAIELEPGMGVQYQKDIEALIEEIRTALSAIFESEEYQNQRQAIFEVFKEKQSNLFGELQEKAKAQDLALIKTPSGVAFAPTDEEGVLSPEELKQLSEEERETISENINALQEELQKILQQVPTWQRETQERIKQLNKEMASFAISGLINELVKKYKEIDEIVDHIQQIQTQVIENADAFLPHQNQEATSFIEAAMHRRNAGESPLLNKFKVNVIIDNSKTKGAPVISENNPTYPNLIGRVEHFAQMGTLMTDFRMIKAGALHKANGGYLIIDARKLLTQPYAWEGLKRAIQSRSIEIESLGQALSLISTVSIKPEAIPLNLKVALLGDRMLYYLLTQYDPEFSDLFKVQADFETEIDWDIDNQRLFAQVMATIIKEEELLPFDNTAIAALIEESARQVSDSKKLNTRRQDIKERIIESEYFAKQRGSEIVTGEDVQEGIQAQIKRADRLREKSQESILREINLISTSGEAVGQINGLSVISLGDFSFGQPTRITAQVSLGKGQVVDIEREVELGGPIHSKGVLILSGFLRGRFAQDIPLSLTASLVFEQAYSGVDGDSASSAELYALLSAIANIPIKQSFAVTGSVNQHGDIQPIGGVNQKIEGFFDICKARGLTGEQGVLIPASNVTHLMLREPVIEAVNDGRFHIYPVEHIDQGITLMTGIEAGKKKSDGTYPEGSINALVSKRLETLARKKQTFTSDNQDKQNNGN